jgi:isocitrate/isopropylmalate dehydrogenase
MNLGSVVLLAKTSIFEIAVLPGDGVGVDVTHEAIEGCASADAVLLGAMGLPKVRWPDGKEMTPQLDLRENFQLYCGLRPIRLY